MHKPLSDRAINTVFDISRTPEFKFDSLSGRDTTKPHIPILNTQFSSSSILTTENKAGKAYGERSSRSSPSSTSAEAP